MGHKRGPMGHQRGRSPAPEAPVASEDSRFRDLLDRLPLVAFETDMQGHLTYVNRAGMESYGYGIADFERGVSATELVVPEDRQRLAANLARRLAEGTTEGFTYRILRKDGSVFPGLVHASVLTKDGRPIGLQGYVVDISERVRAEEALQRKASFEEIILRISSRLVADMPPRQFDERILEALGELGRFMRVDRSYVLLFSPDGRSMSNTHEWVAEGISAQRERLQNLPTDEGFPWFMRELRRIQVVAVPDVAALPAEAGPERAEFEQAGIRSLVCAAIVHGGTLGGFVGIDAVRRPRAWTDDEMALLWLVGEALVGAIMRHRAEAALLESERKYKALVETTATGFVIVDRQGRVLDANAEYARISGHRTVEEIRGRAVAEWTVERDRARQAGAIAACSERNMLRDLEIEYARSDGSTVPVLINASVIEKDGIEQVLSVVRDLSDRKSLEQERLQSEKLRSVGILAGGIAHDFNNILTAILGNASLLRSSLAADGAALEAVAEIIQASLRARDLTQQLLTFSRGGEPVRRAFRPDGLLRESASLALRGRGTACDLHCADGLLAIDGDEGQIGQVVRNLVLNASQAMAGTGKIAITAQNRHLREAEVRGLSPGDYVAISVADRGPGISEEDRSRIFDPYFTTKPDGRGLGLAVSHSVVSNHQGAIWAAPRAGGGSVFTVLLPAVASVPAAGDRPPPALGGGHGRILIMDDEEGVRNIAARISSTLGYRVTLACDGRQAVDLWRQARDEGNPFGLAIMDLTVLGGMGGCEAVRELLALDPNAKVVVSSGYSQDPVMANYRQYGFCEVLAKPYDLSEMSRVLASVLAS
ncbi:MAG: PAS domain S-box protein [Deltaproteobacteria bacterium]|nr:PAS domain S-box protein [Deltaproteobacteria bacterium]